nr:phospholipase A2-alpha-like [Ipomoea batatas]GMC65011.1 phospholipase A2-alpha-like [Ipomoea batatas]
MQSTECSRTCESKFCGGMNEVAPFLRYGKYCGILYSGCPGEKPCDALDACCMQHDDCIGQNGSKFNSLFIYQNTLLNDNI